MTYSDAIIKRLTDLCVERGITTNKLATLSGITQSTLNSMMRGETKNPNEYYGAAEPPVRCGESHLSGLTEPPHFVY